MKYYFLLFYFFSYVLNSCIDTTPKDKYDCLLKSTSSSYCCFISKLEGGKEEKCFEYQNITDYKGGKHIVYNSTKYEIDCGLGSTYMDSDWNMTIESRMFCGSENPEDENDCFKGSSKDNSCCFYKGHGLKKCYNLGIKFEGTTVKDGYTFICSSNRIYINYIVIFVFLMFI